MWVDGKLRFEVVLESGQVLPEVTNGGVTYVVAPPEKRFTVRVTNNRSSVTYRVSLSVDGVSSGIRKIIPGGNSSEFNGIVVNSVGEDGQVKLFQFQDAMGLEPAEQQAARPTALDSIKMGRLQFKVAQVVDSGERGAPSAVRNNLHAPPSSVKLPDGKKWFLAPSLSASNGPTTNTKIRWNTVKWVEVGARRQYTLRYETASTLMLRGILQEDNPAHRKLIQDSLRQEAERAAAAVVKPEPAGGGASVTEASTSRARVAKRGQQQQGAGSSGQQRAPVVDLSVEKDDDVLCDLTGEAPAWRWSKKPKIEIDL